MAVFSKYFPTLLRIEGGYVDDPSDHGGATKYGVILSEWIANGYDKDGDGDIDVRDLKLITAADAEKIAKKYYWDRVSGDSIKSQSVAEFICDWAYNSGIGTAVKMVQEILTLPQDGAMGPKTLAAINKANAKVLHSQLKSRRSLFYNRIVEHDHTQQKFLKGWLARNASFKFIN